MADRVLQELRRHRTPTWWTDAKLGVFIHWTPASVAGFAPTDQEIGPLLASGRRDALSETPYTEWYENSLRFPGSSVATHHAEVWGERPYTAFAADFEAGLAQWDPDSWARTLRASGARYVVLVAKHHDGWCLWPTEVENPNRPGWHSERDIVGELAAAVRSQGLHFGLYYSGGLDWTFDDRPLGTVSDVVSALPRGPYPAYAEAQVRELIERYRPSVLWNDITWPTSAKRLWRLLRDYYEAVPDGVVNDRWMPWSPAMAAVRLRPVARLLDVASTRNARTEHGMVPPTPPYFGVRTPEYTTFDDVQRHPWECVRGMDRSFGFNRESLPEHFLGRDELLGSLVDIASRGGNLLLNVGPRGEDATIPGEQLERLAWLGAWTSHHGEALYGTSPWVHPGTTTVEGALVRYTSRGDTVWALLPGHRGGPVTLAEVAAGPATVVEVLGRGRTPWSDTDAGLRVEVEDPGGDPVPALALHRVTARP